MSRRAIFLRPWRPGDERAFAPRADLAEEFAKVDWDWDWPPGPTWTVMRFPNQVIGVGGGVRVRRSATYQVWCVLAPVPRGDWPLLMRCARAAFDHLERSHGARTLTAYVRDDFAGAAATLDRLGFTRRTAPGSYEGYTVMARKL